MKKDSSTAATKKIPNPLLFIAILLFVAIFLDRWWAWALAVAASAAGVVAFIVHVRRSAQDVLDLLAATATVRSIPAPIDGQLPTLAEHGFEHPLRWTVRDRDCVSAVSVDGVVTATVSNSWQGPLLTTRWESALLHTSSGGIGAPLCPGDYLQVPRNTDFVDLLAAHRDAISVLSRRYGSPVPDGAPSVESMNERSRQTLPIFEARRYRQTARVSITWLAGGYSDRLAKRLTPRIPEWLKWLALAALAGMLVLTWVTAISDSIRVTMLYTLPHSLAAIWLFFDVLEQRRFR